MKKKKGTLCEVCGSGEWLSHKKKLSGLQKVYEKIKIEKKCVGRERKHKVIKR